MLPEQYISNTKTLQASLPGSWGERPCAACRPGFCWLCSQPLCLPTNVFQPLRLWGFNHRIYVKESIVKESIVKELWLVMYALCKGDLSFQAVPEVVCLKHLTLPCHVDAPSRHCTNLNFLVKIVHKEDFTSSPSQNSTLQGKKGYKL